MDRAFVIGSPIRHSISPRIHNRAFVALGIDALYEAAEVLPGALQDWVSRVRGPQLLGFNVTVPHKEAIMPFLDEIAGDATLAGAVNTVVVGHVSWISPLSRFRRSGRAGARPPPRGPALTAPGGRGQAPPLPDEKPMPAGADPLAQASTRLIGLNTDTLGFRRSLAEETGMALRGRRVVVLGAGGAARAIGVVALQDGAASLVFANRHVARAERLLAALNELNATTATSAVALAGEALVHAIGDADVVVNATSVGLTSDEIPIDPDLITPHSLVMDLVYNPRETALLRAARDRGAATLGGLGMLIYQAAAAFEAWTGVEAPIDVMRAAAEGALAERREHRSW